MRSRAARLIVRFGLLAFPLVVAAGCYEETGAGDPAAQSPPPARVNEEPLDTMASQGGGSALGGAKKAAKGTISAAEEKSREVGRMADDLIPQRPQSPDEPVDDDGGGDDDDE